MAYIDRDHFLALLERLGSDRDADVLEAAREIHRSLHEAGIGWNDLLIPDEEDDDEDDDDEDRFDEEEEYEQDEDDEDDEDEEYDYEDELDSEDDEPVDDTVEDRALIERILRDFEVSEDTRDDLKDLRDDIDEGLFTEADRRYLQALLARLEGQK